MKFSLKLSVSVALIALLVFNVDWKEVFGYLKEITALEILSYYAVLIMGMLISTYKWKMLAEFKSISFSFFDFFKLYLAGTFINNFMPSFVGGDTFKAFQIGKKDKKYKEAFSTVIADRITGLLGAMILSLIFFVLNFSSLAENKILTFINVSVFGALALFLGILFVRKKLFWKKISSFVPGKALEFLKVLNGFAEKGILAKSMIWSILFAFAGLASSNYILFSALGQEINVLDYLSVIFLISIVSSIPISVNNIGIKEWAYVVFFGFFGINPSVVVAVAVLSRVLQMMLSFLALPVYLENRKN